MDPNEIKNPIFRQNVVCNKTGKVIKKVWAFKITKLERTKRDLVWEYYRHRGKLNVNDLLKKYKPEDVQIIYSEKPSSPQVMNNNIVDDNVVQFDQ